MQWQLTVSLVIVVARVIHRVAHEADLYKIVNVFVERNVLDNVLANPLASVGHPISRQFLIATEANQKLCIKSNNFTVFYTNLMAAEFCTFFRLNNKLLLIIQITDRSVFDNNQKLTVCFLEPDLFGNPQNKKLCCNHFRFPLVKRSAQWGSKFLRYIPLTRSSHFDESYSTKSSGCLFREKNFT